MKSFLKALYNKRYRSETQTLERKRASKSIVEEHISRTAMTNHPRCTERVTPKYKKRKELIVVVNYYLRR